MSKKTIAVAAAVVGSALLLGAAAATAGQNGAWPQSNDTTQYACVDHATGKVAFIQFRPNADPKCYDGNYGLVRYEFSRLSTAQIEDLNRIDALERKIDEAEGRPGQDGQDGKDGKDGKDGVSGYEVIGRTVALEPWEVSTQTMACPEGKVAIAGGGKPDNPDEIGKVDFLGSSPSGLTENEDGTWSAASWDVTAENVTEVAVGVQTFVTCAYAG